MTEDVPYGPGGEAASRSGRGPTSGLLSADGRLTAVPRRAARREALLTHLAETLFAQGRSYTEGEVNSALLTVHDDFPALRRYLVEAGLLARTRDGSSYRRIT
ncbi:DUF2087 domain-containing protein [Streptomyces sp. YIM 98790]|uniref:DUF2087 domain-containing protein n=1 Tax=Streptomyces sp. YIM 98790 TaxID=2689077 RepID=UPI00140E5534|nr:DUF2087 domain-containing protein [Streptomyces sp. YIM 98790]